MKKLTILISLLMATSVWGEWTYSNTSLAEDKFYIDFERLKYHKDLVYVWTMQDFLEPIRNGSFSVVEYQEVDCLTPITKWNVLSRITYDTQMGKGTPTATWTPEPEWQYARPDSVRESLLFDICQHSANSD